MEKNNLIDHFYKYVHDYEDLTNIKILAEQIHEKLFKNVDTTTDYLTTSSYRHFLNTLVYYNVRVADGNLEKIMEKLFNASISYILYSNYLFLVGLSVGFANVDFWFSIEYLIEFSQEELAFKYEVLYTEKVEERVFRDNLDNIILYDYYKRLSEDAERIAKKEDLPLDEKEKYKKLSLEYQKKADTALGKKY